MLYDQFKAMAVFLAIYIKEAHPSDGWVVPQNERQGIAIEDPRNYHERVKVAEKACTLLKIKIACLVDKMTTLCQVLSTRTDILWSFELPDGRGIRKAVA